MSLLPIILPSGVIAVYGDGVPQSGTGIIATEQFLFGVVDKVWDGGEVYVYGGDTIMFNQKDIIDRLVYGNAHYTLLPARLVTIEEPLP